MAKKVAAGAVVGSGTVFLVSAAVLADAALGNVAEWAAAILAGVAGYAAWRGLTRQQAADEVRDADARRRTDQERRAQAARVWIIDADLYADGWGVALLNGSDAPIYRPSALWLGDDGRRFHPRDEPPAVVLAGDTVSFSYFDFPDGNPPGVAFSDAAGVRWMRHLSGDLSEVDDP